MKKRRTIEFPDCWEEVKPHEWLHLLRLRDRLAHRPGITLEDVKLEWCSYVLRKRGCPTRPQTKYLLLVRQLAGTLGWMWDTDEESGGVRLTYTSTENLLPAWGRLHGPASHGADMTFGEFRHATALMNRYTAGHDATDLQALCAVLYRRAFKGQGFRRREPFRPEQLPRYLHQIRHMPMWVQWGVYAWFAWFCEYLFSGIFIIDGTEVSFAPLFERRRDSDGQPESPNLGLTGVLYSVAESGVFGNADATDDTLLLRVMLKLLDDHNRAKELMKRHQKLNV